MFHHLPVTGNRIAGFSSAGFEAVGIADYLHSDDYSMELAELTQRTIGKLETLIGAHGLSNLVTVQNPLDINPGADDSVFGEVADIMASDENVDTIVAGLVPITPKLHSIKDASASYRNGIYHHICSLKTKVNKPLVFVVDGGRVFDSFVDDIEQAGFPVFRSVDRAVTALSLYTTAKMQHQ
jgi:acyl-CoA synthetase (NDP forming)